MKVELLKCQIQAIEYFRRLAEPMLDESKETLRQIVKHSNLDQSYLTSSLKNIQTQAKICIHFHPDRFDGNLKLVVKNLLESGKYLSQFETRISNGSVSAQPGGARDLWEQELFNGVYSFSTCETKDRPKYGSLQLLKHADGASPNFGSCYFVLKPEVCQRSTFTYLDSHRLPKVRGTIDTIDYIISELLTESFYRDHALGEFPVRPKDLLLKWSDLNYFNTFDPAQDVMAKNSASYIEAQVHGDIRLDRDVLWVVVDPCFQKTDIGEIFQELSLRYNFPIKYHHGFILKPTEVPLDYRGETMPSLAKEISSGSTLTAREIGQAAQTVIKKPHQFQHRGDQGVVLQELKLLWQVLMRFG